MEQVAPDDVRQSWDGVAFFGLDWKWKLPGKWFYSSLTILKWKEEGKKMHVRVCEGVYDKHLYVRIWFCL